MEDKKWYLSKTLWFNVLALASMVAVGFGFSEFEPSPETAALASGIIAAINLLLRVFFTNKALSL